MDRENKIDPASVGSRIKAIRGDLTLEEFGREMGVKGPTVFQYEKDRIPDAEGLLRIAELGKVSVDYILTGRSAQPHVGDIDSGYGKDRELINIIRDVKRIWLAADSSVKDLLRNHLRALKKIVGLT